MGLDMYLYRKKKDEKEAEEVAYWRKANQIRQWIVDNCGYNDDANCEFFPMTKEQLEKLAEDCDKVIENRDMAPVLFPTSSGFFFGSTEYNEWYFDDLKETSRMVKEVLKETDFDTQEIAYYEWW